MNESVKIAIGMFFLLTVPTIVFAGSGEVSDAVLITIIICLTIGFLAICALFAYGQVMDQHTQLRDAEIVRQVAEQKMSDFETVWKQRFNQEIERLEKAKFTAPDPNAALFKLARETKTVTRTKPRKGEEPVVVIEEIHPVLAKLLKSALSSSKSK